MKKTAKLIALILSLALAACLFSVSVCADGTPTVTVESAQASAGDTVAVGIVLSDCAQFSSYTIHISYDSEYVTAVDAKKGINTMLYMPNLSVEGKKVVAVVGGDVNNVKENGVIATLYFKIAEDYPGGITEVPLKITQCKLTEYNGKSDVEFASQKVDGKLVISGAGNVIWNGGEGESELTPEVITDEQAAEYTNPLTNEAVTGGEYYINEDSKIAIPAKDVENGVKNDPDNFKVVEDAPEVIEPPVSSEASEQPAQGSEDVAANNGGKLDWLLIVCIAAGVCVVACGVFAVVRILNKKNADAPAEETPAPEAEPEAEPETEPEAEAEAEAEAEPETKSEE